MLDILLITLLDITPQITSWDKTQSLLMFVLTLAATTFGLVKVTQEVTKAKIAIAKENSVGSVRMEAIEKASKEMGGHIQDVSKIVDALKNKQEVDYEFLSRIFDNLEKDFQSYREIILNNLNRK